MMAMRKTLDERARKKALDAIFNRFDFNQNGNSKCICMEMEKSNLNSNSRENIHKRLSGGTGNARDRSYSHGD